MMKKIRAALLILSFGLLLISCGSDDGNAAATPEYYGITGVEGTLEIAAAKGNNPNPKCYLDLVTGTAYRYSEAAAQAANIDLVVGAKRESANLFKVYAVSPSNTTTLFSNPEIWQDSDLFQDWPVRNLSLFAMHSSTDFETIVTRDALDAFIGDTDIRLSNFPLDSDYELKIVYLFKVRRGNNDYTGAVKFDRLNDGNFGLKYLIKVKLEE